MAIVLPLAPAGLLRRVDEPNAPTPPLLKSLLPGITDDCSFGVPTNPLIPGVWGLIVSGVLLLGLVLGSLPEREGNIVAFSGTTLPDEGVTERNPPCAATAPAGYQIAHKLMCECVTCYLHNHHNITNHQPRLKE